VIASVPYLPEKPLFIPLKGVYFDLFKSGEKNTEYRPYGPRWNERTCRVGREVVLSRGYGKAHRLHGMVTGFEMRRDIVRTRAWQEIYGRKHEHVACIRIALSIDGDA